MHPSDPHNQSQLIAQPNMDLHQQWQHYRAGRSCGLWEQLNLCCHTTPCNAKPQALLTPATNKPERTSQKKRLCLKSSSPWVWNPDSESCTGISSREFGMKELRRKIDCIFVTMEGSTYMPQLWTHVSEGTTTCPDLKDKCNLSKKLTTCYRQIQVQR